MRKLLDGLHYGTACPGMGHGSENVRISLAIDIRGVKIAITPSYFITARILSSERGGKR
jgi:hypothetical protein